MEATGGYFFVPVGAGLETAAGATGLGIGEALGTALASGAADGAPDGMAFAGTADFAALFDFVDFLTLTDLAFAASGVLPVCSVEVSEVFAVDFAVDFDSALLVDVAGALSVAWAADVCLTASALAVEADLAASGLAVGAAEVLDDAVAEVPDASLFFPPSAFAVGAVLPADVLDPTAVLSSARETVAAGPRTIAMEMSAERTNLLVIE